MTRTLVLLAAVAMASCAAPPRRSVTGSYSYAPNAADSTAGCRLEVQEVNGGQVQFQVSCNRGAPSYNMGRAVGTAGLKGTTATWQTRAFGAPCALTITFADQGAEVAQEGSADQCGFGNAVSAAGSYRKVNNEVPGFVGPDGSVTTSFPSSDST